MEHPETLSYLDSARQGRHQWFHFVFGTALIVLIWIFGGSLPLLVILFASGALSGQEIPTQETIFASHPLAGFVAVMASFVVFFFGIWLAMRLVHRRRMRTLVSPVGRVSWQRIAQGFAVWFILIAVQALAEALLYPGRYVFTWNPAGFLAFLLPVLLLMPIQTSAEELMFRGYLLQAFGLKLRNWLVLCILSGGLFALVHITNPEVGTDFWPVMAYFFATGAFLAYVTLKDQRLELALGIHAANNIFTSLVANYEVTVLPTPSLFTIKTLDAIFGLLAYLIMVAVFWLVFFRNKDQPKNPS